MNANNLVDPVGFFTTPSRVSVCRRFALAFAAILLVASTTTSNVSTGQSLGYKLLVGVMSGPP